MAKATKVIGKLECTAKGYGFVEDIFIPAEKLKGALHTDLVEIEVTYGVTGLAKARGAVTRIIERTLERIVGEVVMGKHGAFLVPDDDRLGTQGFNVLNPSNEFLNKKVVGKLVGDDGVKIIEVLGNDDDLGVDITSIIRSYNLYEEFPKAVEDEAKSVATAPSAKEIVRRLDLREKFVITIDPSDAKDLDDAISLEKTTDGMWELGVHIADVSHYVKHGSALDTESYKRATSVYFPDRVIPMLPRILSNDICSLNPNVDRLTLSCIMTIDPNGSVTKTLLTESIININKRFSYDEIQALIDAPNSKKTPSKRSKSVLNLLQNATKLTKILEKNREKRGEVVFDVPEPKIILCPETGKITDVIAYPRNMSHRIIESFMVLANEAVAKKMHELSLPFIYRTHEKPDPVKVQQLIDTLSPFKIQHRLSPGGASGFDYQHLLSNLKDDLKPIIGGLALRSMQKAKYLEKNIGHFGLGATHYCHFTSPIRRYPDLVIHRIVKMMINRELSEFKLATLREFTQAAALHSTKMEIQATEAEREVENLKRAQYMHDRIGEKFQGTISGIRDFGVFVYLPNTCEGLVRLENMPDDTYRYDAKQMILVGKRRTYKMGDKLDIIVSSVNLPRRQIEFAAN